MFGFFSKKTPSKPEQFVDAEVERMSPDAPPHVQALHLILEQGLVDKASEVLMQYDRFRNEFAVYFKRDQGYELILTPPATLFHPMQMMLASAGHLHLPEDEGQFLFPRESGGRLRYSIAVEDEGATMALALLGYV